MILQAAPSTGYAKFPPLNYGGVEDFIFETSKRLSLRNEVGVLYGDSSLNEADLVQDGSLKIFRTPLTRFDETVPLSLLRIQTSLFNNSFAAIRLFSFSRQLDYDLLHMHESHTQFLLAKYSKAPKLFTFHGSHTCIPYVRQTMHAKIFAWKFDGYAAKYCKHLVAISNLSKKNIVDYTGSREDDVSVIHYGVDTEKFSRRKDTSGLKTKLGLDGRPVLICVTRIARDKGLDLTLKSVSELKRDFPDIICLFCGISLHDLQNSAYGKQLQEIISKNNLQENVSFLGKISSQDLPSYLSLADVFVHPARVEAFGLAVGEAMACGLPPVCMRNSGGPDDMLHDGKNGFLVSPESVHELNERISLFLGSDAITRRFGRKAKKNISENFTWDKCAEKLEAVYAQLT